MSEPDWELPAVQPPAWIASEEAAEPPEVDVEMHESPWPERAEAVMDRLHQAGDLAELYEMFAAEEGWPPIEGLEWGAAEAGGEGGAIAGAAEVLSPLGYVALIGMTVMQLHNAFGSGERIQTQEGFVYGLMWEVTGHVDVDRDKDPETAFKDWGWDSASDLRGAWNKGVEEGRDMARDPKVGAAIRNAITFERQHQTKGSFVDPEHIVLNMLWEKVHEKDGALAGTRLEWGRPGYRYTPAIPEK